MRLVVLFVAAVALAVGQDISADGSNLRLHVPTGGDVVIDVNDGESTVNLLATAQAVEDATFGLSTLRSQVDDDLESTVAGTASDLSVLRRAVDDDLSTLTASCIDAAVDNHDDLALMDTLRTQKKVATSLRGQVLEMRKMAFEAHTAATVAQGNVLRARTAQAGMDDSVAQALAAKTSFDAALTGWRALHAASWSAVGQQAPATPTSNPMALSIKDINDGIETIVDTHFYRVQQTSLGHLNDGSDNAELAATMFNKTRDDTLIRIQFQGSIRVICNGCEPEWQIRINGNECFPEINARIHDSDNNDNHRIATLEGICREPGGNLFPKGLYRIDWSVSSAWDTYSGWNANNRFIIWEISEAGLQK